MKSNLIVAIMALLYQQAWAIDLTPPSPKEIRFSESALRASKLRDRDRLSLREIEQIFTDLDGLGIDKLGWSFGLDEREMKSEYPSNFSYSPLEKMCVHWLKYRNEIAIPQAIEAYLLGAKCSLAEASRNPNWRLYVNQRLQLLMESRQTLTTRYSIYSALRLSYHRLHERLLIERLLISASNSVKYQRTFWESLSYPDNLGWRILGDPRKWLRKLTTDELYFVAEFANPGEDIVHIYPSITSQALGAEEFRANLGILFESARLILVERSKQGAARSFQSKLLSALDGCRRLLKSK